LSQSWIWFNGENKDRFKKEQEINHIHILFKNVTVYPYINIPDNTKIQDKNNTNEIEEEIRKPRFVTYYQNNRSMSRAIVDNRYLSDHILDFCEEFPPSEYANIFDKAKEKAFTNWNNDNDYIAEENQTNKEEESNDHNNHHFDGNRKVVWFDHIHNNIAYILHFNFIKINECLFIDKEAKICISKLEVHNNNNNNTLWNNYIIHFIGSILLDSGNTNNNNNNDNTKINVNKNKNKIK